MAVPMLTTVEPMITEAMESQKKTRPTYPTTMTAAPEISAVFPPNRRMMPPETGAKTTMARPEGTMQRPAVITLSWKP
ncbi:hypothetical protein D9M72_333810 [compost metagenome]